LNFYLGFYLFGFDLGFDLEEASQTPREKRFPGRAAGMRQEGALSRSESRLVRQEKAFAEGTRAAGGCVCRIARVQGRGDCRPCSGRL